MLDHFGGRLTLVLKHLLHQVDAAAWGIELVAKQHVGRAGGGAESAVHALADHGLRRCHGRIGENLGCEACLHQKRPVSNTPAGSNARRTRSSSAASPEAGGWKARTVARVARSARTSVACPPARAAAARTSPAAPPSIVS